MSKPAVSSDDQNNTIDERSAKTHFVQGLISRGEAVATPDREDLPPGATHEIVDNEPEMPSVRRRRFSYT